MALTKIISLETLKEAVRILHDGGFKADDLRYDKDKQRLKLRVKCYKWKGKYIQRQTTQAAADYELVLSGIDEFRISDRDSKGLAAVQEDYVNEIEAAGKNSFIIATLFRDIHVTVERYDGELRYLDGNP